jgi:hypothetical protein
VSSFTREVKALASYDHRDEPGSRLGAHGVDLVFILRGELGAITASISTGWMAKPLAHAMARPAGLNERLDKPGVDRGLRDLYPSGRYVGSHSLVNRSEYMTGPTACDWLDGAPCYDDGSFTAGGEVMELLVTGGSDAVFERLERYYQALIVDRPRVEVAL